MHLPLALGACFGKGLQETLPVGVILEDGFPTVAAIDEMIDRSRIFDTESAGHARWLSAGLGRVNATVM